MMTSRSHEVNAKTNDIGLRTDAGSRNGLRLRTTDAHTFVQKTTFKQIFEDGQEGGAKLRVLRGAAMGLVASTIAGISMISSLPSSSTLPFTTTLEVALATNALMGIGIGAFALRRPRDMIGTAIAAVAGGGLSYLCFGLKAAELYAPIIALIVMVIMNFTGRSGAKGGI